MQELKGAGGGREALAFKRRAGGMRLLGSNGWAIGCQAGVKTRTVCR